MEIERKWLVPDFPVEPPRKEYDVCTLYLDAEDEFEVRLHRKQRIDKPGYPAKYKVTFKTGNGLSRQETETPVSAAVWERDFAALEPITEPIHKLYRKYSLDDGHTLEVSEVDGRWCYAEVEFASEEEANAWQPIDYLANATEVTGDPMYQMKNYWRRTRLNEEV